jgi:hypothetical protein
MTCTECEPGMTASVECYGSQDTICRNMSSCEITGAGLRDKNDCPDGSYHAGCDPDMSRPGKCEPCPIQKAIDCPSGFFLNFNCTDKEPLSTMPNECVACNRFECEFEKSLPSKDDCGDPDREITMKAETITCSQSCTRPQGDVWIKRACDYFDPLR